MHITPTSTSELSAAIAAETLLQQQQAPAYTLKDKILKRHWSNVEIMIFLNSILCFAIALTAYLDFTPMMGIDYLWFSPIGCLAAVMLVRGWMKEGDVDSLEQFRYKYKGA